MCDLPLQASRSRMSPPQTRILFSWISLTKSGSASVPLFLPDPDDDMSGDESSDSASQTAGPGTRVIKGIDSDFVPDADAHAAAAEARASDRASIAGNVGTTGTTNTAGAGGAQA